MESHLIVAPVATSTDPATLREQAKCMLLCVADLLDNPHGIYAEAANLAVTVRAAACMIETAEKSAKEDE